MRNRGPRPSVFTPNVVLLLLGCLAVFLILSWEFVYREVFHRLHGVRPVVGALAKRDVFSPVELKAILPSTGKAIHILRGERIANRGDRVSADQVAILQIVREKSETVNLSNLWGNLLLTLLMALILIVSMHVRSDTIDDRTNYPLLVAVITGILAAAKTASIHAPDLDLMYLLNPMPVALVLIAIFVSSEQAIVADLVLSILCGVLYNNPRSPIEQLPQFQLASYTLIGGLVGIFSCSSKQSERSDILRVGVAIGLTNVVTIMAFNLIAQEGTHPASFAGVYENCWYGFCNGIGCSMMVLGLVPFLEDLFHVTTSTRLLELINPNQPLLQRLITEAPGTFHHSQNVAHLAEKAAEEVDADSILAKAAAYYHDLGKIKRPWYFIENQMGGVNYHDSLTPQLSKLIIHSHTKDGAEIAESFGLPKAITDIMIQHHGTDLVAFFYHQALKEESAPGTVDELSFRYPGPKAQTREAAIIMMADACEAASRTIRKPTPQSIENLVSKIINDKFVDGQFDECDLTKRDCEILASSFTRTLVAMFHARIQYPADLAERARATGEHRTINGLSGNGKTAILAAPDPTPGGGVAVHDAPDLSE